MELWVIATLLAATFQTARFMLHKVLSMGALSATGSAFARFAYAAPLAVILMAVYLTTTGVALPSLPLAFWLYAIMGGVAQILATICVVALFAQRNFAVGVTLKKTEAIMTALVGLVILGEALSLWGWSAVLVGVVGVLTLSGAAKAPGQGNRLFNKAMALGLASGLLFSFSSVGYRGASLEVANADPFVRSSITLAMVTCMQAAGMALWLMWRDRGQLRAAWAARRTGIWLGATSAAGSLMWFTAFTLQTAAYVKALGQVELLLSIAASTLFFKERISGREYAGIAILMVSIVLLVFV